MGDEQWPGRKRIRLTGTRFDGGRLPVDSLVELQKYQGIVRIAAEAEWRQEHPEEDVPSDLHDSLSLTIAHIDEGSADILLEYEQHQNYAHYQVEAQDAVDAVIAAVYSEEDIPKFSSLSPEEETTWRDMVAQLGETLSPDQTIELYPSSPDSLPVTINIATRKAALDRLALSGLENFLVPSDRVPKQSELEKEERSVVGKVTALDADNKTFTLMLPGGQSLRGRYPEHPELLEDFRKVLNSAAEGPLTRITGELQLKDGKLFRFWGASKVEQVQFDETSWGARLSELAALMPQWNGDEAAQISSVALDAAQMVLRAVDKAGVERPGVFPTEEGGVLIEWSNPSRVRSIEVLDDGSFETFSLDAEQEEGAHLATQDFSTAIKFVEAIKA